MVDLVKRYIMSRQSSLQTEEVTEDDLQEIKQDISAFRYELLEILRSGKQEIETLGKCNLLLLLLRTMLYTVILFS